VLDKNDTIKMRNFGSQKGVCNYFSTIYIKVNTLRNISITKREEPPFDGSSLFVCMFVILPVTSYR